MFSKNIFHLRIQLRISFLLYIVFITIITKSIYAQSEFEKNDKMESSTKYVWTEDGVNEGKCLEKLPEHVPIDTFWLEQSFQQGFYAPLGSSAYFYIYSQLLNKNNLPLESSAELYSKRFCLRVSNGLYTADLKRKLSDTGSKLVTHFQKSPLNYVKSFILLHFGFESTLIFEDCSSGLLGEKKCKVKSHTNGVSTYVSKHVIHWTVSLTDNSTYGVVVKCMDDINAKAWVLMSTVPKLPAETILKVKEHVKSLGFSEDHFIEINYDNCLLGSVGQNIVSKTKAGDFAKIPDAAKISDGGSSFTPFKRFSG